MVKEEEQEVMEKVPLPRPTGREVAQEVALPGGGTGGRAFRARGTREDSAPRANERGGGAGDRAPRNFFCKDGLEKARRVEQGEFF